MPKLAAKYRIPVPRGLALLLGTAALALVLSSPAHAQVTVDYSQLDGMGARPSAPVYDDRHSVQSPLAPGQAAMLDDETPTIIGGKSKQPVLPTPKSAIALKPLPKWHMPVPAQPISLGARGPLLLHPPGSADPMIADLAKQSLVENSKTAELHLRPPAPKPPMPVYAQNGTDIAPPLQITVAPMPVPQMADNISVPMPMTQIGALANIDLPVQPQTQIASMVQPVVSTAAAMTPPAVAVAEPQSDLRAEDVVALDLGAPKHDEVPGGAPAATPSKQTDAGPVAPPELPPAPIKTASSASPQFVSSLAEDDVPPDHNKTNNHPQHDADVLPPSVLRAPESSASKTEDNKKDNHKLANAAPPSFTGSLNDDEDMPAAKVAPAVPVKPVATAAAEKPQFTSSLAEDNSPSDNSAMMQDASGAASAPAVKTGYLHEPADKAQVAAAPASANPAPVALPKEIQAEVAAAKETQFLSSLSDSNPKADDAARQNTATEIFAPEPDLKTTSLQESENSKIAVAPISENPTTPAEPVSLAETNADSAKQQPVKSAHADVAPLRDKRGTAKKMGYLKEPVKPAAAAATDAPDAITWNNTPAAAAPIVAAVNDSHASAQQAADTVSDIIAQDDLQKKQLDEVIRSQADVAAKEKADAELKIQMAAKAKAEADAKAKADELAKVQADTAAKVQADATAKAQAEAELKAQTEAKTKTEAEAKAKADELVAAQAEAKAKSDELAKVQADAEAKAEANATAQAAAIAKVQADAELKAQADAKVQIAAATKAQADAKAQMDAMAKAQADELVKVRAEADVNKERLAQLMERQAKIESQAKAESSMASAPQDQIKADSVIPLRATSKTQVMELPKVIETSPVQEAAISTGAINDASGAAARGSALVQQTLMFQPGSSVVPGDASSTIQQLSQNMKNNSAARMVINAYADTSVQAGSAARRLSLQRAILVRDELNKMGVPINRMAVRAQTSDPGTINPDRVEISVE